jgi:hypothetical protein
MTKAKGVRKADDLMRRLVQIPKTVGKLPNRKKKGGKKKK